MGVYRTFFKKLDYWRSIKPMTKPSQICESFSFVNILVKKKSNLVTRKCACTLPEVAVQHPPPPIGTPSKQ